MLYILEILTNYHTFYEYTNHHINSSPYYYFDIYFEYIRNKNELLRVIGI
jgi:hypothetical protein